MGQKSVEQLKQALPKELVISGDDGEEMVRGMGGGMVQETALIGNAAVVCCEKGHGRLE